MSVLNVRAAVAAAFAVSLVACGGEDPVGPENSVPVQFVNLATDGAINVQSDGQLIAGIPARSASANCVMMPAGAQSMKALYGPNAPVTLNASFTAGTRYSVIMWPAAGLTRFVVPEVQGTPSANSRGVRFINSSDLALDVYAQVPTAALPATPVATIPPGSVTGGSTGADGFVSIPNENTRFLWYVSGTRSAPNGDLTLSGAGSLLTAVYVPSGSVFSRVFAFPPCA